MRTSRDSVPGLQETATTVGTFERASCSACACAPERAGSKTTASMPTSSLAASGMRKRSRTLVSMGFRPWASRAAADERRECIGIGVDRQHAGTTRQRKREGAEAAEEVGDALGRPDRCRQHEAHHVAPPRHRHRLYERTWRRVNVDAGEGKDRLPSDNRMSPSTVRRAKPHAPPRRKARIVLPGGSRRGEIQPHVEPAGVASRWTPPPPAPRSMRLQHLAQRRQRRHDAPAPRSGTRAMSTMSCVPRPWKPRSRCSRRAAHRPRYGAGWRGARGQARPLAPRCRDGGRRARRCSRFHSA